MRKAELFHLPRAFIVESSKPTFAAVVAAPMRKLWPAKCRYGRPTAVRASLTLATKYDFVSGSPSARIKKGPTADPLCIMYVTHAVTGQRVSCVRPTKTSIPWPS